MNRIQQATAAAILAALAGLAGCSHAGGTQAQQAAPLPPPETVAQVVSRETSDFGEYKMRWFVAGSLPRRSHSLT